jgi:general secretion pathway protein A
MSDDHHRKSIGYYTILGFDCEPFATSPDPEFFYPTQQHEAALTNLLIELRLRRGLSVIFGDVGTGKSTLSRKLLHELNKRGDMIFHMILNPAFTGEMQFLATFIRNFDVPLPRGYDFKNADIMDLRDLIEKFLIQKTYEDDRTVVLVIDEAQKLDLATLETLRVLLNFETNDHKLIQLVLFGQLELYAKVIHMHNFLDRISFKFTLNPLDAHEVKELIYFRIAKAGYRGEVKLFLDDAMSEIYNHSRGYPRKVNMICHKALKELVVRNQRAVDAVLVRDLIEKEHQIAVPMESTYRLEPIRL